MTKHDNNSSLSLNFSLQCHYRNLYKDFYKMNDNIIKEERLKRLWSQARLSREACLSIRTIARVENGENCNEITKRSIAQALDKNVEDLFDL